MLLLLFALSGDVEAHLSAKIEANRTIAVELAYELTLDGAPPANGELVFWLLEMDEARIENLRVGQDRRPLRLDRSGAPKLETAVPVGPGTTFVTFYYETVGTTIPILVPSFTPSEARPGTFTAELQIPEGSHLVESFPTGARKITESRYALELPVLPAFIRLHIADRAPFLSFPQLVDGSVIVLFAGLAFVAIRRVRAPR